MAIKVGIGCELVIALALAACAGLPPTREPVVLQPGDDLAVAARVVAARARDAEVVYVGELHDNPHHHAAQARILEAIVASGARPAVAFEMLSEEQQAAADEVAGGSGPAADADRRLRWQARGWPDFTMYWPIFEAARRARLPVVAADLDPAVAWRIGREGLAALGDGAGRVKSLLPSDPAREGAIAETIQRAHCNLMPERRLPAMVEGWHARNVTMARRLGEALGRVRQVVVIVGRGHQDAGGLPAQLEALRPGTRQLVVTMLEAPAGEAREAVVREAVGDIVWLTPAIGRSDPCAGLRQRLGDGIRAPGAGPGGRA